MVFRRLCTVYPDHSEGLYSLEEVHFRTSNTVKSGAQAGDSIGIDENLQACSHISLSS